MPALMGGGEPGRIWVGDFASASFVWRIGEDLSSRSTTRVRLPLQNINVDRSRRSMIGVAGSVAKGAKRDAQRSRFWLQCELAIGLGLRNDSLPSRSPLNGSEHEIETVVSLKTRKEGAILLIYFQDVSLIDESRIEVVGKEMMELIDKSDSDKFILNFSNVGFMSSAMISKVINFGNGCKKAKVRLRLCDINANVRKVFDLMRLEKVFNIDADEEASLAKLSGANWLTG